MKVKFVEVEIRRKGDKFFLKSTRSLSPVLGTVLIALVAAVAAVLFASLVRTGVLTLGGKPSPHVNLIASLKKHDNISVLRLRLQAGESLKSQHLELRIDGWMENSEGGRSFVRYYIHSLPTTKELIKASYSDEPWSENLYVKASAAEVAPPQVLSIEFEGLGENVRFISLTRLTIVHTPSRSVIFSCHTPLRAILSIPPPVYPGLPGETIENIYIENTLITTAESFFDLKLGSGTGKIWLGYGTDLTEYRETSVYDNGKLGIGTLSPEYRLDVCGTARIYSSDNYTLRLEGGGTYGEGAKLNFGDADHVYLQENRDDMLLIYAKENIILAGGNVGIGTFSPLYKLDVSGDVHAGSVLVDSKIGIGTPSPQYPLDVAGTVRITGDLIGGSDDRLNIYHNTNASDSRSWIELWGDDPNRAGELTLAGSYIDFRIDGNTSDAGTVKMRLTNEGNLGVKATNPCWISGQKIADYTIDNFAGWFPGVCLYTTDETLNDSGYADPPSGLPVWWMPPYVLHDDYSNGYASAPLPTQLDDEIDTDYDGTFRYWWFIGKPPAPYLYCRIGYVDDYSDVYLRDITANTTKTVLDEDGYGKKNVENKVSLDMSHEYILMAQYIDTDGDGDLTFWFWFGWS